MLLSCHIWEEFCPAGSSVGLEADTPHLLWCSGTGVCFWLDTSEGGKDKLRRALLLQRGEPMKDSGWSQEGDMSALTALLSDQTWTAPVRFQSMVLS